MRTVLILILVLSMAATAVAHDLFIMPERFRTASGESMIIGFHSGDGFPDSTQLPLRLRDAALHVNGKAIPIDNVRNEGKRSIGNAVVTGSGYVSATIVAAPTTISMEPGEFHEYLQEKGLTGIIDARTKSGEAGRAAREKYGKYAKALLLSGTPNEDYKRPAGLPIEFIPEKSPAVLKVGDSLPVQVLFRGAAAADLEVRVASATPGSKVQSIGRTDANGRISIPITAAGPWRLHTIKMERSTDPAADWESFWSTLTFEVR